jgi:hypothetical protein
MPAPRPLPRPPHGHAFIDVTSEHRIGDCIAVSIATIHACRLFAKVLFAELGLLIYKCLLRGFWLRVSLGKRTVNQHGSIFGYDRLRFILEAGAVERFAAN